MASNTDKFGRPVRSSADISHKFGEIIEYKISNYSNKREKFLRENHNQISLISYIANFVLKLPTVSVASINDQIHEDHSTVDLLLNYLAPVADHLGHLWEDDICDFLTVTQGMARLQSLTQQLCIMREEHSSPAGRRILLMPSPGELHTYGLTIVESLFRQAGWSSTVLSGGDDPIRCLQDGMFDAIGLSIANDIHRHALLTSLPILRRAASNPNLCVILGGSAVERAELRDEALDVDVDAYLIDVRDAPDFVEAWIEDKQADCAEKKLANR